jgi:uncharacterized membrane protein AbrB (regulator of aidB expression)
MDSIIQQIINLFKDSYIIRGLLALALTGVVVYMWINQIPLPDRLLEVWLLVLGYYFGVLTEKKLTQ